MKLQNMIRQETSPKADTRNINDTIKIQHKYDTPFHHRHQEQNRKRCLQTSCLIVSSGFIMAMTIGLKKSSLDAAAPSIADMRLPITGFKY
jgi:hypothetical protein